MTASAEYRRRRDTSDFTERFKPFSLFELEIISAALAEAAESVRDLPQSSQVRLTTHNLLSEAGIRLQHLRAADRRKKASVVP